MHDTTPSTSAPSAVGLRSLAVAFPERVRTNDDYRRTQPELVASAEQRALARLWARQAGPASEFDRAFASYADDPFRGTVERRVLGPGEAILAYELQAAEAALAAASVDSSEIDLLLSCAFLPDQLGVGNGVALAQKLGIAGPAWNLETACSSATAGLLLATAMVEAGRAKQVLVVISCSYSRVSPPDDSLGWFLGDGCVAFVIGPTPSAGVLASKTIHTARTCGAFRYVLGRDDQGRPGLLLDADAHAGRSLRDSAGVYLRECVDGALAAAGCRIDDVEFFAFNTPTAWYAEFCARTLGIPQTRTVDSYPLYANTGPVLWPTNLHHAASLGRVRPGDLVLVYSVGSVSSAGAVIMRWGEVGLGPLPERARAALCSSPSSIRGVRVPPW